MSTMALQVTLRAAEDDTTLRQKLARLRNVTALHGAMALSVERLVIKHMRTVKVPLGNKLGAPSTGFWRNAIASVRADSGDAGGVVRITQRGVALQYYGGTVTPKTAKALTIPIAAEAHGKTVGDFKAAGETIFRLKGSDLLCRDVGGKPQPLFVLRQSATIRPHADVLPTAEELQEAAAAGARRHLRIKNE